MQDDEIDLEFSIMESNDPEDPEEVPFFNQLPEAHPQENPTPQEPQKKKNGKKATSKKPAALFEKFLTGLEQQKDTEAKLKYAFGFMKSCIAQNPPFFKGFWEARIKCLELFKENIPSTLRTQKWEEFSDLSKEARRMKDQLDEQSNFAQEQIDIAISAIEKDLEELPEVLKQEFPFSLPEEAHTLNSHFDFYQATQIELHHLNLAASRVTSLRKELIKTEMRVRIKNKFFDRLSKIGDMIFPRRKTLIQEISQTFMGDVEKFIETHFSENFSPESIGPLREEIKALQQTAKFFTLNTQAFSQTRLLLSQCWDKLKEQDKERKIEWDKRKEEFRKNEIMFKEMIETVLGNFTSCQQSPSQSLMALEKISILMRSRELGRDEVKTLRTFLAEVRSKVHEKQKEQDEKREQQEEIRMQQRKLLFQEFKEKVLAFLNNAKEISSETILEQKDKLVSDIQKSSLSKPEKAELEKLLKNLKDILREKKEVALRSLPDDDRQALLQLRELLKQKQEERQEIKEMVEHYRKKSGLSGIDFEKGLEYSALMAEEKEKLERAYESVKEVEMKIDELESKLSE